MSDERTCTCGCHDKTRELRARIRELEAEREQFMALPSHADVTLARLAGAEAALRWAWENWTLAADASNYELDENGYIQRGLEAVGGEEK